MSDFWAALGACCLDEEYWQGLAYAEDVDEMVEVSNLRLTRYGAKELRRLLFSHGSSGNMLRLFGEVRAITTTEWGGKAREVSFKGATPTRGDIDLCSAIGLWCIDKEFREWSQAQPDWKALKSVLESRPLVVSAISDLDGEYLVSLLAKKSVRDLLDQAEAAGWWHPGASKCSMGHTEASGYRSFFDQNRFESSLRTNVVLRSALVGLLDEVDLEFFKPRSIGQ